MSCPHYLAEMLVYTGLLLLEGGRLQVWLMLAWVVSACCGCNRFSPAWRQGYCGLVLPSLLPSRTPPSCDTLQVSNLLLAAGMTQEWYRAHFKTYPRDRRAVLPFLY